MKKLLTILALVCASTLAVNAQEGDAKPKRPELTAEQKALRKEMIEKYDANKDGKLDKEERAKMSAEDKAKWEAAFPKKPKEAPKTEETK
jgi:hypothetical protein